LSLLFVIYIAILDCIMGEIWSNMEHVIFWRCFHVWFSLIAHIGHVLFLKTEVGTFSMVDFAYVECCACTVASTGDQSGHALRGVTTYGDCIAWHHVAQLRMQIFILLVLLWYLSWHFIRLRRPAIKISVLWFAQSKPSSVAHRLFCPPCVSFLLMLRLYRPGCAGGF